MYAIHWFRRDLRVASNPALTKSRTRTGGKVLGLFCVDPAIVSRSDTGIDRFAFVLESVATLRDELRTAGGDLLVLPGSPEEAFGRIFSECARHDSARPAIVSFNRDYEPFARDRDARLTRLLEQENGVEVVTDRDHLVLEPGEIIPQSGDGHYRVFSPFEKRWRAVFAEQRHRVPDRADNPDGRTPGIRFTWNDLPGTGRELQRHDVLDTTRDSIQPRVRVTLPPAGGIVAHRRLSEFLAGPVDLYDEARDMPAVDGTSRLSIYLKVGAITTAEIIAALDRADRDASPPERSPGPGAAGTDRFLTELIWREFYYHILYHQPRVEHEPFLTRYSRLEWDDDESRFNAWKAGLTGFPIVDAGMRQLNATGWMHNRVRMIVASFLTKDLHIDWRRGEAYFMDRLLDGDLAANNGGWQWAASTGCDPQPYFRIFNPERQSRRFDADGAYIARWVPELTPLDKKDRHAPTDDARPREYPAPIVDHLAERKVALERYKKVV